MASSTPAKAEQPTSSPLLRTTISLVLLQLVSRLFSFTLNQLLLRSTTPQALGVATMGFEVVRDTGLFLLREGVRGAVVRTRGAGTTSSPSKQALLSQTLLLPSLFSPLLILFFFGYSFLAPSPLPAFFNLTLIFYAVSAVLELLAERWYLETLQSWETLTSTRVRIEGMAVGTKAIGTLAAILVGGERFALLSFGVGQLVYGATLLVGFWWTVGRKSEAGGWSVRTVEKKDGSKAYFDKDVTGLSWALTTQSLVKQFLTEGDKIAVGRLSKVEDQGGYAVALNYGSLIARILFQPLEETSRLYFSRHLATPTRASLISTSSLLSSLLLLHTHLSLIFLFLAPSYTSPLLYHLLGPRWSLPLSSAPIILAAYCTYLPFLAINGITEAFFQSVAAEEWLRRGSWWMGGCSVGFLGAVALGVWTEAGERGLIYANCFNMAMRIGFSSVFVRSYYKTQTEALGGKEEVEKSLGWRSWTPKTLTTGTFLVAWRIVRWSEDRGVWKSGRGMVEHVAVGAVCGVACLAVIYRSQRRALLDLSNVVRRKTD